MILFAVIVLSIIMIFNKRLGLIGILIFSLAIPSSFDTTSTFSINIGGFNFLYTDILVGIAFIIWALSLNINHLRGKQIKKIKITIYILIYLTIIGVLRGLLFYDNISQIFFDSRPIFYYLIIIVSMDIFGNEKDLSKISKSILIGLSIYCVLTLSFFILNSTHPFYDLFLNVMSGFNSRIAFHNDLYFLFAFPLLIFLIVRSSFLNKLLYLFLFILFTFQLIVTMSRTLLFLSIIGIIFSLFKINKRSFDSNYFSFRIFFKVFRQFLTSTILVVLSLYIFFPNMLGDNFSIFFEYSISRFSGLFENQYSAHILPRINLIEAGIDQIIDAPIFGHGFGYFFTVKGWENQLSFIDNSFVTLWIRLGFIGLVTFFLIFFYFFQVFKNYNKYKIINSNLQIQALNISIPIGLILILVCCLNVSFLVNSTAVLPLFIILGSTIGFWTREIEKSKS